MPPELEAEIQQDDLRATIVSAMESDSAPSTESIAEPAADAGTNDTDTQQASQATDGRARDESGRYVAKDKSETEIKALEKPAEKAAASVKDSGVTDKPTQATEQPSTAALTPPVSWTPAEKAEWSKLSPALQGAVSRREAEMSRGGQQWSEEKRRYESVLAPVAEAAQRRGIPVDQGIQRLMAAQNFLDRDPKAAIAWLAQSYGVDLATHAGQPVEGRAEHQPDIATLVRNVVEPMLGPIQQRFANEDRSREMETENLVDQFANSPGHEHWKSVETDVVSMIPFVKGKNPNWTHQQVLQEAYDRAVYANPETRNSILSARDGDAEARRVEEAKQRASQARRAGSSVTGNPSGAPAAGPADTLRAEIERAMNVA